VSTPPVVEVRDLVKLFPTRIGRGRTAMLRAVDGVSFDIDRGETLGLVGESGSGKSTMGRLLVGLTPATSGTVRLFGHEITGPDGARNLARARRRLQLVFQDPYGSLDPRMRVGDSIAEPLDVQARLPRAERRERIGELLAMVGLPRAVADRYPHEFSGGQRQRLAVARALALRPELVVCDEPVSALDVSMQAQIVNLLADLQESQGLSYLFVAHDLAVVRQISTRVAVMYGGALVELAPRDVIYRAPRHPYTRALLDAVPVPRPGRRRRAPLAGDVPSLLAPPTGCRFQPRCPLAEARCATQVPAWREIAPGHHVACHLVP
jgi:oligopeptide/dipeptide ABC transporter ATP-binding protein